MIDFEIAPLTKKIVKSIHNFGETFTRKIARYYDEYEHEHELNSLRRRLAKIKAHQMGLLKMMQESKEPGRSPVWAV